MELSGIVAILTDDLSSVAEVRDLGPDPVSVRPGRVRPLVEIEPMPAEGQVLGNFTDVITETEVTRTYSLVPEPPPEVISDRQFFQRLANMSIITEDEALAAVQVGAIPAAMLAIINLMPEASRFAVKMLVAGATDFHRSHEDVASFLAAMNWTDAQRDQLWRDAAKL